ncbi:MAG TPA: hypothetical protein VHZ54_19530 [Solirubrobacterales bacterium]|nr:hypothetical protein [Solirubrobacterales bacterium]
MPPSLRKWLTPAAWVVAVTAVLLIVFPVGFPNYDTIYALVWGRELAHGISPDYGAALPPTPHPLTDFIGLVASPFGEAPITVIMVLAYVSLGLIAYFVYRLGTVWFDKWVGVLAAVIVLTRAPFLSNGLRAYVDLPYIALCLGALYIEARKPRAGWPVLALLVPAGLLRPEAWGFAIAYWLWLALDLRRAAPTSESTGRKLQKNLSFRPINTVFGWEVGWRGERSRSELAWLGLLALGAPIIWVLFDAVTTGNPLYSLTGTQETVESLKRQTGPVDLVLYGPRRLGEVMQWPGMVGGFGGLLLGICLLRRRSALGFAAVVLALLAFAVLAGAGLAIIARYTMLAGAILSIFFALALLGWRFVDRGNPWRRYWQVFAGIVLLMVIVWLPNQWNLDKQVHTDLTNQGKIENALSDLVDEGAFSPECGPIAVPNHRAVPRLAFGLDVKPTDIVSSSEAVSGEEKEKLAEAGYFVEPASSFVIHNYILDPNDKTKFHSLKPPPGFHEVASNDSWRIYSRCGG